jgi:acetoin:2,6-dichlorophenolindophenol oxidoreductase subunit alpha
VTYRFKGHVSVDPGSYRDPAEVAAAQERDPLLLLRQRLQAQGVSEDALGGIDRDAQAEIDEALRVAQAAPWPEARAAYDDVMNTGAGVWR